MLYRQTRGHPLFTIELLRGMQERGDLIQDQSGRWNEGQTLDWETLPARVEAVVAERISRLDNTLQAVLRIASVEGETFTVEVIQQVLAKGDQDLLDLLNVELDRKHRLISAQSIQRVDGRLISTYRFRHILTQRYLYSRLNEVERVHLHEQVGTNLETLYCAHEAATGEEINTIAPQLARHFQEARIATKAINYLRQAGERATTLSAYLESIALLEKGLAILLTLPESPDRDETELELQLALGIAYQGGVGGQAPGLKKAFTRARELCEQLGKKSLISQVTGGLSVFYYVRADYRKALELARTSLSHAEQAEDPIFIALGHWYNGFLLCTQGEFPQASKHLAEVVDFYDPQQHHYPFVSIRGSDAGTGALAYDACCLWCLGYPDQAMKRSQEAFQLADELNHPYSQADVICHAGCLLHAMCRDAVALQDCAERLMNLAETKRLTGWLGTGLSFYAESLAMQGNLDQGIPQIIQGIIDMKSSGILLHLPGTLYFLAEAQGEAGQPEVGLKTLGEALALVEQRGDRLWEAEIHRLKADLLCMQGEYEAAERNYHTAIEVARGQSAKSWELRVSTGLASFWKSQGRIEEARVLLGDIYAWFTEGFDTLDLKEAKALLEEMS
jgi:tetratricopeptide (TPR) repeat protein